MKINLFKPKESVQSAVDRPDPRTALLLVLLPPLVAIIGFFWQGFPINPVQGIWSFARSIINWILISATVYVILYFFKGKEIKGKFGAISSALSLLWIVNLLLSILGLVFFPIVFSPEIVSEAKLLATGQTEVEDFVLETSRIIENNPGAARFEFGLIAMVIGAFLALYSFYLVFLLVRDLNRGKIVSNLAITLVCLIGWLLISSWIFQFL